jgi:ADP-ribose pyrophosphatase
LQKPDIETLASSVVYQNRWMSIREDRIIRSDGSPGIYGVVEKPDFAVIAAVEADRIFLVEQYRYPVGQRFWELPQGSWEKSPLDPLSLAKAELREETGLVAGSMVHAGHLFLAYGFCTQGYNIFLASDLQQCEPKLEPEEQGLIARPFSLTEFEIMMGDGTIKDATTIAAYSLLRSKGLL